MRLPQQLPDGESVFEMAVESIHSLGMQAKAFYWNEELTQSQERRVKLWKLPQQPDGTNQERPSNSSFHI
ncbi:hypothetical protein DUI87_17351 [Hirundo rustica rustica]|uniref:Uncharacterized protein n=1 Tax=Hirundo rustica rustica TaxID=333673 RepID=A0A3M0JYH9_HIRRU|nr:hypothetical protein DUI87_17351 [Hirundo rustica rustica]